MTDMMDVLYLTGIGSEAEDTLFLPSDSLVALFTLIACHPHVVEVIIVPDAINYVAKISDSMSQLSVHDTNSATSNLIGCVQKNPYEDLNYSEFSLFPVSRKTIKLPIKFRALIKCPPMVRSCSFPAVKVNGEPCCIAGLSSSLRHILKKEARTKSDRFCEGLLGFRGGCLQACAEVSVWTKFCEVESVLTLQQSFALKYENGQLNIPKDMMRFEHHLQHPPVLHNALKRKQDFLKTLAIPESELSELLQKKLNELPELEHNYAEGLDMTLADVILLTCFHIVICKLSRHVDLTDICPLVLRWHDLLLSINNIKIALPFFNLIESSINKVAYEKLSSIIPVVPRESLYKSDPDRYKPRWRAFTHQHDIDSVIQTLASSSINPVYSVHPRDGNITLKWLSFPSAVNPQEGQLPLERLERKRQQLDNIVSAVFSLAKDGDTIVDFCSGGGHLAVVLAYCLPNCTVLLVENKEESLSRAKVRIKSLDLKNVQYYQCNLDYFYGQFDIGVSLHACGVATDLVMRKCYLQKASFVCCPCCYGAVQPNHILDYPRSGLYKSLGLQLSEYIILGHAADQTHGESNPKTRQGQLCMRLIDYDRLSLAASLNYTVQLIIMTPETCSPKNHLLIGFIPKNSSSEP